MPPRPLSLCQVCMCVCV
uniref:Uncharacterized protein n=1 Tax=Anguilla anguilla TaxID=7936 RepID=A0A0E9QIL1_ANGAN